ncbi:SEC-C domain-containing protein [Gordonia sp. HY002]|uniref:YecA/YgfB family protein n=1 Tax=Gordonia zhenghanii TaxID=2911516 RepID=UPI001EEFE78E|nr:SEC-C metal-binding domain-containing protein [Gordonia zhenghanii]MCF8570454.1 SEC-C domain-containing protein [Gordonia zhenghanii]MCF8602589.1 SEC-C domain-containing protein [Gordonia zhenghanii]
MSDEQDVEYESRGANALFEVAQAPIEEHVDMVNAVLAEDDTTFDDLLSVDAFTVVLEQMYFLANVTPEGGDVAIPDWSGAAVQVRSAAKAVSRAVPRTRVVTVPIAALATIATGDLDEADSLLQDAVRRDDSMVAVRPLALLTAVRGDYEMARSFLADLPDPQQDPLFMMLTWATAESGPEPGRNEPCWCGSGRKYKVCHRGQKLISPSLKNWILLLVVTEFLELTPFALVIEGLESIREDVLGEEAMDGLDRVTGVDLALFEGGGIARFINMTHQVLPVEDALLLEAWQGSGRSVFEVESVTAGAGMSVRDIRTDERFDVLEENISLTAHVGMFVCTRVVSAGDVYVMHGGIEEIEPSKRVAVIDEIDGDADPFVLVDMLNEPYSLTGGLDLDLDGSR